MKRKCENPVTIGDFSCPLCEDAHTTHSTIDRYSFLASWKIRVALLDLREPREADANSDQD
ncbi:hypothetical protein ACTXT7_001028 [Hymenolepis weldensis]